MTDWLGKTLGKVRIDSLIARGGMAEVYLGTHTTLHKEVAVKVMRGPMDDDQDTILRFQREARVVAGLRHPNVIQILDHDFIDDQPYLVMEYVAGPTLSTYLKELHKRGEQLPMFMVNRILTALAHALDHAHSQNIVHRDIKPANVLLRAQSEPIDVNLALPQDVEPILTDFGLVRLLDASIQTSTGAVSGTPTYMSPEQARGDKVGVSSDIYSMGVILYEMLAGRVPFEAESTFGILLKHINEPPPPIPGISYELQAVIDRTLAKEPSLRYGSAGELANEFNAIFNGETISPDTLKNAELARQFHKSPGSSKTAVIWKWLAAGVGLIALGFAAFQFLPITPRQNAPPDPNIPVGKVVFSDFNWLMDKATISLTNAEPPASGQHYEVWFLGDNGRSLKNAGKVQFDEAGQGQLIFINKTESNETNVFESFNQIEVTNEADDDPDPDLPGDVLYSSMYPPEVNIHLRELLVSFEAAPDRQALIQGLWTTTVNIYDSADALQVAYQNNDEALVRKKTEEIINQIVGDQSPNYMDWNSDGELDDPGDGYGLLKNGSGDQPQGYVAETIARTELTIRSSDATQNIIEHGNKLITSCNNIEAWSNELLDKARLLNQTALGSQMESIITEILSLADKLISGVDQNGNGLVEPIDGESGSDTAYEDAYNMADMPLLRGANRIPLPAGTQTNP